MVLNFYPWTIDISDEVIYLEDSISFEQMQTIWRSLNPY